jgi:catechol 2,3-dioxygenase-like lactoylglutathione lyase family enzyme
MRLEEVMFSGAHVIIYSRAAEADRAFIRDHLGLASVDAGDGWLIFKLPPAEIAIHPTDGQPKHEFYFTCENIEETLEKLAAAGAVSATPPSDEGYGLLAEITLPSGTPLALYEPRHPVAYDLT